MGPAVPGSMPGAAARARSPHFKLLVVQDMTTDHFIDEVEEELKRERHLALWQKYGRLMVAGALAVVIGVAATVGWRHYQQNRRTEAGLTYTAAVEAAASGRGDEALAAFGKLSGDAPAGFAELARLQQAAQLARQGNEAGAAAVYDAMAKDSSVSEPFRNLALLLHGLATLDRADPAALTERLKPLVAPTSAWRYSAQELTALLARRRGDEKAAREIFKRLADDATTPPSVRARAAEFLALGGK